MSVIAHYSISWCTGLFRVSYLILVWFVIFFNCSKLIVNLFITMILLPIATPQNIAQLYLFKRANTRTFSAPRVEWLLCVTNVEPGNIVAKKTPILLSNPSLFKLNEHAGLFSRGKLSFSARSALCLIQFTISAMRLTSGGPRSRAYYKRPDNRKKPTSAFDSGRFSSTSSRPRCGRTVGPYSISSAFSYL